MIRSTLFKKTDKKINFDGADLSKSKFNMNWDNFTQTAQFSFSTNFSEVRFNDRVCPKLSKGGCNPVVHSNSLKLFWGNESN